MKMIMVLIALLLSCQTGVFSFECPKKPGANALAIETDLDCPWAGAARLLADRADNNELLEPVFSDYTPGILKQLDADKASPEIFKLWGKSINFDEMARSTIVHPSILSFFVSRLGLEQPGGRIVHAGMEHTYGYLFSLIETKYGFKRNRWVKGEIELGLGLEKGLLGPSPKEGTLLGNVTCLASNIALRDDLNAKDLINRQSAYCPAALKKYASGKVERLRLTETVKLARERKVVLRTDFIPFSEVSVSGNAYLLIYSVHDLANDKSSLITLFPVGKSFVLRATGKKTLGSNKTVKTRYNAWVEGFSGKKFKGLREAFWMDK